MHVVITHHPLLLHSRAHPFPVPFPKKRNVHARRRLQHNIALQHRRLFHPALDPVEVLQDAHDRVGDFGEGELLAWMWSRMLAFLSQRLACLDVSQSVGAFHSPMQIRGPPLKGM